MTRTQVFVSSTIVLALFASCGSDDFKEGQGSKAALESFVAVINGGATIPNGVLSSKGTEFFRDKGGSDAAAVRAHVLSPSAKECRLLGLAGRDAVLTDGRVTREAKLRVSSEADGIDFESIYNVRFELSKGDGGAWLVDRADTVAADLTLANTGIIFKIYYVMLTIFGFLAAQGIFFALRGRNVSPSEAAKLLRRTVGAFGTMLSAYLFSVSWFAFFFPQTFSSHFGFYWALSTISVVMRQLLLRYNYGHFRGQMPGSRFLVWAIGFVPILIFLTYSSKFKPEQTSALSLSFDGPPIAETTRETILRADASDTSESLDTLAAGTALGYLGTTDSSNGKFLRVVHEQTTIGFVPADVATVKAKPHTFETEAEFTTELEGFFRTVGAHKAGVPARLADIGRVYLDDGLRHARRGSVRDHLEALSRYREAFKYRDDDELRLAGAASILEIVRVMKRDNVLNTFGLAHTAAVSYNKTRALAAYTVQYLQPSMADARNVPDQRALIALAHFLADDDRKAGKDLPAQADGRYLTRTRAFIEEAPAAALALWEDVSRADPDDTLPFAQQGMRLLGEGNLDRADAAFSRALGVGPESAEARVGTSAVLIARGNRAGGEKLLDAAAHATSYNSEARVLGFVSAYGRLLTLIFFASLLFAIFAGRVEIVYATVVGTWLRVGANGTVFAVILLALWYRIATGHAGVGEPLKVIVHRSLF